MIMLVRNTYCSLVKEGDGVAVAVLRSMSVDLEELSANIEKAITSTGGMMTIGQMLPLRHARRKCWK